MRAQKVSVTCANCGSGFLIPPCRVWREKSCSSKCKVEAKQKALAAGRIERTRSCNCCGKAFVARQGQLDAGQGRYCSNPCAIKDGSLGNARTPEAQAKRVATWRKSFAAGRIVIKTGPANPCWKGGREAAQARITKEQKAAMTRSYRRRNPEKVREFAQRRNGKRGKGTKLPAGTVARLLLMQGMKCAICRASVATGYHVDHIYPIAKGGTHTPDNVQILCPTCNVRKSDKHPIRYMQERGMLL